MGCKVAMTALLLFLGRSEKLKIEIGQRKQQQRDQNGHGRGPTHLTALNAFNKDTIDHRLGALRRTTGCHYVRLPEKVSGGDQSDGQDEYQHRAQHGHGDQEELLPWVSSVDGGRFVQAFWNFLQRCQEYDRVE